MIENDEFQIGINRIIAESKLSDTAREELAEVSKTTREAIEALVANGYLIENGKGGYVLSSEGQKWMEEQEEKL